MYKIGFIGYGSMGSMLVNRFIKSNAIKPNEIIISTRTTEKLESLTKCYTEIELSNIKDLAQKCKYIFICVRPREVKEVITEIKQWISDDAHIISIAACVTIENLEKILHCKISKVIPSFTAEAGEGFSLVCHNNYVDENEANYIESLFASISKVKIIDESDFEAGADLTSCAPGFFSSIILNFVEAGVRNSNFNKDEAEKMVVTTLYATLKLLFEKNMAFEELVKRVATKGGISEEGIRVIDKYLPDVFDEVFKSTLQKHEVIKKMLKKEYEEEQ